MAGAMTIANTSFGGREMVEVAQRLNTMIGNMKGLKELKELVLETTQALEDMAVAMNGSIPQDAVDAAKKMNVQTRDLVRILGSLTAEAVLGVVPALSGMVSEAKKWLDINEKWLGLKMNDTVQGIAAGFKNITDSVRGTKEELKSLYETLKELGEATGIRQILEPFLKNDEIEGKATKKSWKDIIEDLVTGALLWLAVRLGPLGVKLLALLGVLVLIGGAFNWLRDAIKDCGTWLGDLQKKFDDFKKWAEGLPDTFRKMGDSARGFYKEYEGIIDSLLMILGLFAGLEAITSLGVLIGVLVPPPVLLALAALAALLGLLYWQWDNFKEAFPGLGEGMEKALEGVRKFFSGIIDSIKKKLAEKMPGLADWFGLGGGDKKPGKRACRPPRPGKKAFRPSPIPEKPELAARMR